MRFKSLFIVFDGIDGSGKTIQAMALVRRLRRAGRKAKYNDEPGSTAVGFKIRALLIKGNKEVDPLTEFFLFEADRSLDYNLNILPFIRSGFDVVQDRNYGSTFAYQGYGRGLLKKHAVLMKSADLAARRGLKPDLIFLLDGDPRILLGRIKKITSFEKEGLKFFNLARKGFLAQAKADKKRWVVLNALESPRILEKRIWQRISKLI